MPNPDVHRLGGITPYQFVYIAGWGLAAIAVGVILVAVSKRLRALRPTDAADMWPGTWTVAGVGLCWWVCLHAPLPSAHSEQWWDQPARGPADLVFAAVAFAFALLKMLAIIAVFLTAVVVIMAAAMWLSAPIASEQLGSPTRWRHLLSMVRRASERLQPRGSSGAR